MRESRKSWHQIIPFENNENHEIHITSIDNYENHDNPRISREHNWKNENLRIQIDNK